MGWDCREQLTRPSTHRYRNRHPAMDDGRFDRPTASPELPDPSTPCACRPKDYPPDRNPLRRTSSPGTPVVLGLMMLKCGVCAKTVRLHEMSSANVVLSVLRFIGLLFLFFDLVAAMWVAHGKIRRLALLFFLTSSIVNMSAFLSAV